jgi:hypothetical protein
VWIGIADGRCGFHQGCWDDRSGKADPAIVVDPLWVAACGRVRAPPLVRWPQSRIVPASTFAVAGTRALRTAYACLVRNPYPFG